MKLVRKVVADNFNEDCLEDISIHALAGGCINHTGWFEWKGQKYFLKWNKEAGDLFAKEVMGLNLLRSKSDIGVPEVLGRGKSGSIDYLCLSFISEGVKSIRYWSDFGVQLAQLHQNSADSFGLSFDNHIGKLPQSNTIYDDWVEFFINQRLLPQIKMANSQLGRSLISQLDELMSKLPDYFPVEKPALIHGDLWSGNIMAGQSDSPYIFDPAVYYGHREVELAFTTMFGGFDQVFYDSYEEAFPLEPGFEERVDLYNLYPLLVHVNLFGGSYLSSLKRTLARFV